MLKILLVDDSITMRGIEIRVLQGLGPSEIVEADDGVQALKIITDTANSNLPKFDLYIIDWNMPNMDGLTLVRRIREKDRKTPIVMATTESEKTRILQAVQAGVNNYVVKPFTSELLLRKIQSTLEKMKAAA